MDNKRVKTPHLTIMLMAFGLLPSSAAAQSAQKTPSATEPEQRIELVEVRQIAVNPKVQSADVWGVVVSYHYRVSCSPGAKGLKIVGHLRDEHGAKVRSLVDFPAFRGPDGALRLTDYPPTETPGEWQRSSYFIPFYALKLAPGQHRLELHFEARKSADPSSFSAPDEPVKQAGESNASFTITKPAFKMVQLLVREVEVAQAKTDASFLRPRKGLPDLQWRVTIGAPIGALWRIGTQQVGVFHVSSHQDDRYSARWTRYSKAFPLSEGDRMTLSVVDHDVMSHDLLGRFTFDLEELSALGKAPPEMSQGAVLKLVLGAAKSR